MTGGVSADTVTDAVSVALLMTFLAMTRMLCCGPLTRGTDAHPQAVLDDGGTMQAGSVLFGGNTWISFAASREPLTDVLPVVISSSGFGDVMVGVVVRAGSSLGVGAGVAVVAAFSAAASVVAVVAGGADATGSSARAVGAPTARDNTTASTAAPTKSPAGIDGRTDRISPGREREREAERCTLRSIPDDPRTDVNQTSRIYGILTSGSSVPLTDSLLAQSRAGDVVPMQQPAPFRALRIAP